MRPAFRLLNAVAALGTAASALAVLASDLAVPGYQEHHRDALWFVAAYAALQLLLLVEFARDGRLVPWLALGKTAAAYAFLANFLALWPAWQQWTPARYVYQLFEWGGTTQLGLFVLVFLGRGAFNTFSAAVFTQPWWGPLRVRRPFLGRLVTAVWVGLTVMWVWVFFQLVREESQTFSLDANNVARVVFDGLDCEAVRTRAGQTTTDLRERGDRRYQVQITYDCALTRVVVRGEDGRLGTVAAPRRECCPP